MTAFLSKLRRYVGAIGTWLHNGRGLWYAIGFIILVCLAVAGLSYWFLPCYPERYIRITGVFLEISGLWVIATEFARTQAAFAGGSSNPVVAIWEWGRRHFADFPKWPSNDRSRVLTGHVSETLGGAVGTASGTLTGEKISVEQRVERLEEWQREVRGEMTSQSQALKDTHEQIDKARADQEEGDKLLAAKIKDTATGGLAAQAMGWVWIVCGVLLANLAEEIAKVFQKLGLACPLAS